MPGEMDVVKRNGGQLLPLEDQEAEDIQHELADDPAARFFRVAGPVEAAEGRPPLRLGDTLIALEESLPREGDLIVVRIEGNGYLLGTSRKGGTWCLLTSGAAVPLRLSGREVRMVGVVVGIMRKVPTPGPVEPG